MSIRIAIPEPTSPLYVADSAAYNQRSLPQYLHALLSAGATPIPIPLHESQERVAKVLATCHGILLPGSPADVDPQKYGEEPHAANDAPDPARAAVDELLIQDAFNLHKPVLGICQGLQALNVWLGGTIVQDIPSEFKGVNHAPGRTVTEAHTIAITAGTRLAGMAPKDEIDDLVTKFENHHRVAGAAKLREGHSYLTVDVNSSHHQAIRVAGDKLTVAARCPEDGIIEAVELDSREHWVVAVQWHPERTYNTNAFSRAIFAGFVHACEAYTPRRIEDSVLQA